MTTTNLNHRKNITAKWPAVFAALGLLVSQSVYADWADSAAPGVQTTSIGDSPHGVAVHSASRLAVVVNKDDDNVQIVNIDTGITIATVPVADKPVEVVVDSTGAKAYVLHEKNRISVIDIAAGTRAAEWSLSGEHVALAIHPAGTELAVASKDPKRVNRLATASGGVTQAITLSYKPKALAYTPDGARLLLGTEGSGVRIYSTASGAEAGNIAVGDAEDLAYWAEEDRALLLDRRKLHILNTSTYTVEASIAAGSRLTRLAIDASRKIAYAVDRDTNAIVAIDLAANVYRGRYTIGEEPTRLGIDVVGPTVLATFKKTGQLARLDPVQAPLAQSVYLGEKLSRVGVAVDDAGDRVVALAESGKAFIIDLSDKTFTSVPFAGRPTALGIDDSANVAIIGLNKKLGLVFVDLTTNTLFPDSIPLDHHPVAIAVDPTRGLALVAIDKSDQLVLVDTRNRALLSTLSVQGKFKDAAIHRGQGKAYIVNHAKDHGEVLVYDLTTQTVTGSITVSKHAESIVIDETLNQAFVAIEKRDTIEVIDLNLGQVTYSQPLSRHPLGLAINPDTHTVVVVAKDSDQIALLDLVTRTLAPYFTYMEKPLWVAVTVRYNQALITAAEKDEIQFLPLPNPVPELTEIVPPDVALATSTLALIAVGKHFIDGAKIYLDDRALVTRWRDLEHLEADVPADILARAGILQVKVVNPTPAGGASNALPFTVQNPVPVLTAISPAQALQGSGDLSLNVTGEKFVSGSIVRFGATDLVATFVNPTHLVAVIPAALLAESALVPVTVVNPGPGGGASAAINFLIAAPAGPQIDSISPIQGEPGTLVTIRGRGFESVLLANKVTFGGNSNATVLSGSATQLVVPVPPGALTGPIAVATPVGTALSEKFSVLLPEDFTLVASPSNVTLIQNASNSFSVQLTSTGTRAFTSLVKLSAQGLPNGVTAEFSPAAITGNQVVTLKLTASGTAVPEMFNFTVVGTATLNGRETTRTALATVTLQQAGQTGVKGRFVDPEGKGIAGVYVRYETLETTSDAAGNFMLLGLPAGTITLRMDATPANSLYPIWPFQVSVEEGKVLVLSDWVINPPPPAERFKPLIQNSSQDQVVTDDRYPGLKFTIPAGASIIGWDGVPKDRMAVERIEVNKLPVPPPPVPIKESYQLYFGTPMGGIPSQPIPVTLPNVAELEPGDKSDIWYFDGSPMGGSGEWKVAGPGTVSADGKTVTTDPGYGIPRFCGVCGLVSLSCPPPPPGPQCGGASGGNPVDLYSGQEFPRVGEMSCGGVVSFDIARSYGPVDAFGNRAGTTGSIGYGWVLNYDIMLLPFSGPQKRLVIPPNQRVNFTEQPDGTYKNTDRSNFGGAVMRPTPNAPTNHWDVVFKDGRIWRFKPYPGIPGVIRGGPPLFLSEQIDPSGNVLSISRTSNGHLTAVGVPGRTINATYGANNFISELVDSIGRTVRFTYDSDNRLETVTDSSNGVTRYTYVGDDEFPAESPCAQPTMEKRIKTIEYPGKSTPTENHYGPSRRVLRQTSALGEHKFAYKLAGACVTHISNPGVRQIGSNVPDTDSWEIYQAGWRIYGGQVIAATVTDPKGNAKTYAFNASGGVTEDQNAIGNKVIRKYDANNRLIQETNALGNTTRYGYDEKGNRIWQIDAENRLTEYDYDPKWNKVTEIRRAIDANSKVMLQRMTYDPTTGNLASRTDANNRTTSYTYTARGQIESVTDPKGNVTHFAYNAQGDLVANTDPLGNTRRVANDAVGRMIEETGASGYSTGYELNARDQQELITQPDQSTVKFEYDVHGNLWKVTNQNNQIIETNSYDEMDRVLTRTDSAGKSERFTYDINGNTQTVTDRLSRTTTYTYNESNRLTRVEFPDGDVETRTYDILGRLVGVSDSKGTISYRYDGLDRVIQESTPQGTVSYGYDIFNRRTRIETPQQVVTRSYDNAGLLRAVTQGTDVTAIDYDENSRRSSITYPNGIVATLSYDDAGRLTNLVYRKDQTVIESLAYTYDVSGNIVDRARVAAGSKQESPRVVQYDQLTNRLTSLVNAQGQNETFAYDDNGNMVSRTNSCGTTTFTWNVKNQLTQIQGFRPDCSVLTASFVYDALGRRIQRTINGETTTYLYDGMDIIAEMGATTASYLRTDNIDEAIARYDSQSDRYFLSDLLGSTHVLTDRQGNATTTYSYTPYGETEQAGQQSANPVQYTGRDNDGTGLYYYRARYYAPDLARFISSDPIGLAGGTNFYLYAQANPLINKDPSGLDTTGCDGVWDILETPCILRCCAYHDQCFDKHNCSSGSWPGAEPKSKCDNSSGCKRCNANVVGCIAACHIASLHYVVPPAYYCAAKGIFVSSPDEEGCEKDHAPDCDDGCGAP